MDHPKDHSVFGLGLPGTSKGTPGSWSYQTLIPPTWLDFAVVLRHPSTARGWDSTLRIGRMESIHGRKKMILNMFQQDVSRHAGKSW